MKLNEQAGTYHSTDCSHRTQSDSSHSKGDNTDLKLQLEYESDPGKWGQVVLRSLCEYWMKHGPAGCAKTNKVRSINHVECMSTGAKKR